MLRVQHRFSGPGAADFLKRLTPASIDTLPLNRSTLSVLLHPSTGGIIDDIMITRLSPDSFYVVTNAGCRDKDIAYLKLHIANFQPENPSQPLMWDILEDWGLVALQGPLSAQILTRVLSNPEDAELEKLYFGESKFLQIKLADRKASEPLLVSRGGYTGEDGFEISISPAETNAVVESLFQAAGPEQLRWAGLGARDSLRWNVPLWS